MCMKKINALIQGTFYLTLAGFLSRIIGFFYRIFLSQKMGAEGMGIYQLIFPVFSLAFALSAAGIQTAISKFVAKYHSIHYEKAQRDVLTVGLFLSICLSFCCTFFLYENAQWIADCIISEPRCAPLIRILAWSVPLEAVHACINGYYYGQKKAGVPALTQLVEQSIRVLSVLFFYEMIISSGKEPNLNITVLGIVFGEGAAMIFSLTALLFLLRKEQNLLSHKPLSKAFLPISHVRHMIDIISLSTPLSANRVIINLLGSAEAILIPIQLKAYGMASSDALSVYGVLTGMALPIILFPSAITNSLSVILLPVISEEEAKGNLHNIHKAVRKTIYYCSFLGIACTACFIVTGSFLGNTLFHTPLAGRFIITLSFICPFLYLSTTLNSILHGLGRMTLTFFFSLTGIGIRLLFTLILVPHFGITGYLWGLLLSQLAVTFLSLLALRKYIYYNNSI